MNRLTDIILAEVGARSEAQLGKVKTALELIKWYHGPKKRDTKEPFICTHWQ